MRARFWLGRDVPVLGGVGDRASVESEATEQAAFHAAQFPERTLSGGVA